MNTKPIKITYDGIAWTFDPSVRATLEYHGTDRGFLRIGEDRFPISAVKKCDVGEPCPCIKEENICEDCAKNKCVYGENEFFCSKCADCRRRNACVGPVEAECEECIFFADVNNALAKLDSKDEEVN